MEKFRQECINVFDLDPAHYYSLPGYSCDAMVKYCQVELELLSDLVVYMFFEKSLRGGICQAPKRYGGANNPYQKDFDPLQEIIYLLQVDANNLYALSLREYFPHKSLSDEQLRGKVCSKIFVQSLGADEKIGYAYEVEYPNISTTIYRIHLPYLKKRLDWIFGFSTSIKNTGERTTYRQIFRQNSGILCYALFVMHDLGLEINEFHIVVEFEQSPWMRPYIDFNTDRGEKFDSQSNSFEIR